ncbi:hypothetical protein [Chitinophaga flava]|nr:hypothetical protein [Chitinophaga flava]
MYISKLTLFQMMPQTTRNTPNKAKLAANGINNFNEIFDIVPPFVVAVDINLNYYSLQKRMKDHALFNLHELLKLSKLVGCKVQVLIKLALKETK